MDKKESTTIDSSPQEINIVPYGPQYDEQTVRWLNDPDLKKTFGLTRSVNLEGHREWLKAQKDYCLWAIVRGTKDHLGNVSVQLNTRHASGYLQIYIGKKEERRKGVGVKTMTYVLDYCFLKLQLHRVCLHVHPENEPALRLYKKLGFIEEGLERESIRDGNTYRSHLRLSILEEERNQNRRT